MSSPEEIKRKMSELVEKWKGQDPPYGSMDYLRRGVDRIRYRVLRDELMALDNPTKTSDKLTEEELKEIFNENPTKDN